MRRPRAVRKNRENSVEQSRVISREGGEMRVQRLFSVSDSRREFTALRFALHGDRMNLLSSALAPVPGFLSKIDRENQRAFDSTTNFIPPWHVSFKVYVRDFTILLRARGARGSRGDITVCASLGEAYSNEPSHRYMQYYGG